MKKVAVIGAGIFGCEIACNLAENGYLVDLYETKNSILSGSTSSSLRRLHIGFHYPRDLETVFQSKFGYEQFKNKYSTCLDANFKSLYGLSSVHSMTTKDELDTFLKKSSLGIVDVEKELIEKLGISTDVVDSIWETSESVIDIEALRNVFLKKIKNSNISLKLSSNVEKIDMKDSYWSVVANGEKMTYNYIIRSTYGLDSITSNRLPVTDREYEYEKTFILEVSSDSARFGYTVIDGDFITVLPKANTNNFLIYCPKISTTDVKLSNVPPKDFWEYTDKEVYKLQKSILKKLKYFLPGFKVKSVVGYISGVRTIKPSYKESDKRVSSIIEIDNGFFDVVSGKIDHCVEISERLLKMLNKD